jgi:hypothetical protein
MLSTAILALLGVATLMVLGMALVFLLVMFLVYKLDRTYEEVGFWGNARLEIANLIAGKFERFAR